MSDVLSQEVVLINETGLHVRPAATIVNCAIKYKSEVTLSKEGNVANAKSALSLMTLAAEGGSKLLLTAKGEDSAEAIRAIASLFENQFRPVEE